MDELDSNTHLHLLENHIGELEERLRMLRDQIAAMLVEDNGIGAQNELLTTTCRAMRCLELLRLELRDDMAQPPPGNVAFDTDSLALMQAAYKRKPALRPASARSPASRKTSGAG
jgi:hypothetical protein